MIGMTDPETAVAIANGTPGFSIALAELNLYWDNHAKGRPDIGHEPVINIRVPSGAPGEGADGVAAIAKWLGVPMTHANGTYMAMRRFGPAGQSVIVEAHHTPDPDAAFALVQAQAAEREAAA